MTGPRPRILVIDDEPQIHRFLGPALEAAGYEPQRADTAEDGLRALALRAPDVLLLDLGLPDMDGRETLARARAFFPGPILILSARAQETEKIDCLDAGADDYVQKPFGVGELLARVRTALRHARGAPLAVGIVRAGDVEIDLDKRLVRRAAEPVRLSPKEYDLLQALVAGAGRVVTHRQLLSTVWGEAHVHDLQYLRVFVGQLRQRLETDPAKPKLITTEAGVGYRFQPDKE